MNSIDIINKTKRHQQLSDAEINWLVNGYTKGEIPDYQMSAWLMAVCINGLTEHETITLTKANKHSTGGVGDKTSLIIGPAAAACGLSVPKMSGRGLGHTGGTIDKLESISGFRTELPFSEFTDIVKKTGFSIKGISGFLCI